MKKFIGLLALAALVSGCGALHAQNAVMPNMEMGVTGNIFFPGGPTIGTYSHGVFTPSIPAGTVLVKSGAAPAHEYVSGVDSSGNLTFGYVNFSDVVGTASAAQGGSGVASPTAHSLMVAEGASPYNLLTASTGGRVLLDHGAGVDPAFEVMSGDAAISANGTFTLATANSAPGTYGDATHVAQVSVDAKGRATAAQSVAINIPSSAVSGLGNLATQNAGTGLGNSGNATNLQPASASEIGGVNSIGAVSHEWIDSISTAGLPHQSQPTFGDISGSLNLATQVTGINGVPNGGTGAASMTASALPKGNGTSPYTASALNDNGVYVFTTEPFNLRTFPVYELFPNATTWTGGQLGKLNSSGNIVPMLTTDTDGVVGIVQPGSGSTINVAILGEASCAFDSATTAGDWVTISSTVAGDCHDTGSATRATGQQQVGQVLSTNAGAGTYAVNIDIQFTPAGGSGGTTPASNVTYTPPGTGGVVQTQSAVNARRISVADYGAVGDGATDDTGFIQKYDAAGGHEGSRYRDERFLLD